MKKLSYGSSWSRSTEYDRDVPHLDVLGAGRGLGHPDEAHHSLNPVDLDHSLTLSRIIKRQVLTNSMVAILTFWSTTDSDHVRAVPVALLSITINHSGARFWPQKEKTSASTFFSLSFVMIFIS